MGLTLKMDHIVRLTTVYLKSPTVNKLRIFKDLSTPKTAQHSMFLGHHLKFLALSTFITSVLTWFSTGIQ